MGHQHPASQAFLPGLAGNLDLPNLSLPRKYSVLRESINFCTKKTYQFLSSKSKSQNGVDAG
jgi:hypothetical protein